MNFTRKTYNTSAEKTTDFIIGFVGWWVVNGLMSGAFYLFGLLASGAFSSGPSNPATGDLIGILGLAINCLIFAINIGVPILFAFIRQWIALGWLAAFGAVFLIAICAGLVFLVYCFAGLGAFR